MGRQVDGEGVKKDGADVVCKMVGAIQALKMTGSFNNAALYGLYKQIKDGQMYKLLGMEWKEFCRDALGHDYERINSEIKMLEEYGEPFIKMALQLKLSRRELNALGSGLSEDARAEVKRGVVKIGDTEFKIEELEDNVEEFKSHIDLLCKQKELEQKEKKHLEKKLEGIEKEHKKEIQVYEKEVLDLRAKVVDPALPEAVAEVFRCMEGKTREIFTLATKIRFDDAHAQLGDIEKERAREEYRRSIVLLENQFNNAILRLRKTFGVETGL